MAEGTAKMKCEGPPKAKSRASTSVSEGKSFGWRTLQALMLRQSSTRMSQDGVGRGVDDRNRLPALPAAIREIEELWCDVGVQAPPSGSLEPWARERVCLSKERPQDARCTAHGDGPDNQSSWPTRGSSFNEETDPARPRRSRGRRP